ncbi:hypothetical protein PCANC_20870 [Puccinia coronata f. sp. avenae]|uniref:Uncharacterized protein n=2 Tax=Puccinia coronata f. sp. avenae TaxID=200324 RepID=A0A2N5TWB0_9BASI|nr:hypothetical protein PCANC_20870 [Puccinia coronata f. sp. avenae]
MVEEEFEMLVGLLQVYEDLDSRRTDQDRLLCVLKKLRRKSTRCHQSLSSRRPASEEQTIDQSQQLKNSVRWRLRTQELPRLHAQLARLSQFINPSCLSDEPNEQFREAVAVLLEMEDSVAGIKSSASSVWDNVTPAGDDQDEHIEEMTVHRCNLVVSRCKSTLIELSRALAGYERFFRALVLSEGGRLSEADQPADYLQQYRRQSVPRVVAEEMAWIEDMIRWLALSNLHFLQDEWQKSLQFTNNLIGRLAEFAQEGSRSHRANQTEKLIQSLIPLVKISRIFFNKLCLRPANSSSGLKLSSMPFDQLESLRLATTTIPTTLNILFHSFRIPRPYALQVVRAHIASLSDRSKTLQAIFVLHFRSLDSGSSSSRVWFDLWLSQFNLAMTSFQQLAENNAHDQTIANESHVL